MKNALAPDLHAFTFDQGETYRFPDSAGKLFFAFPNFPPHLHPDS